MSIARPNYLTIEYLVSIIDEPHGPICMRILNENRALFEKSFGSTRNHQSWPGGYIDHVTDGMNYVVHLYALMEWVGRPLPFTLSDALLVFFLHDLEKPWRIRLNEFNTPTNRFGLRTKVEFRLFREAKFKEYGLELSDYQIDAIKFVEGEIMDYTPRRRTMNELASFCHMVDNWSARGQYDYPKVEGDEWHGAGRIRTTLNDNSRQ